MLNHIRLVPSDDALSYFVIVGIGGAACRRFDARLRQSFRVSDRERDAARAKLEEIFRDTADRVDRDSRIHTAVRLHHYQLTEVADYLGLHFSAISVVAKQQDARIRDESSEHPSWIVKLWGGGPPGSRSLVRLAASPR